MTELRCGTCAFWRHDGSCLAPVPMSIQTYLIDRPMGPFDGIRCPAWKEQRTEVRMINVLHPCG